MKYISPKFSFKDGPKSEALFLLPVFFQTWLESNAKVFTESEINLFEGSFIFGSVLQMLRSLFT